MDLTDIRFQRTLIWIPLLSGLLLMYCFGSISPGGMVANRKIFAAMLLPGVVHLPHTHSPPDMAFSKNQPTWGAYLASDLQRLVAPQDAASFSAAIAEPMAGNQSQRHSSYWGSYACIST
ncbi:hypothetical protein A6V36_34055 [Paraburkholderia ginsengiterrae]|uniref:Uncharacterized protein n=1 Tax=Paraburkholderia ginsengiterrae TaxID=1462993 RepID=A0A1A9N819_9BURK|nr:hypothetical protein A6V36_34055 [Paraburkholderia ginsengiterrae]OAJ61579.1 hypothetical protein A6V37_24830 [Paraburkholderia ginsengiterrae]